jgi:hypothetical protein
VAKPFSAARRLLERIEETLYLNSHFRSRLLWALRDAYRDGEKAGYGRGRQDAQAADVGEQVRRVAARSASAASASTKSSIRIRVIRQPNGSSPRI